MIDLPRVTLACMTSVDIKGHINALEKSMKGIRFGEVLLITDFDSLFSRHSVEIPKGIETAPIKRINNIDEWNYAVIYLLPKYVKTDFLLLVHADGYVVNPHKWNPDWLNYDYIGAPWPIPSPLDHITYRDKNGVLRRVGNSVSLRSKRLLNLANDKNLEWKPFFGWYNEDGFICCNYRHVYEESSMKFAPVEVAKYFSRELDIPDNEDVEEPFCFHLHKIFPGRNSKYIKKETIVS